MAGRSSGQRARESAYTELVAGLLDAREDVATVRFDAELAAAEADGRIDPTSARVLRWWQRASVRAVVEHARTALPPVLAALDEAHDGAVGEVAESARALDEALAAAFPSPHVVMDEPPRPAGLVAPSAAFLAQPDEQQPDEQQPDEQQPDEQQPDEQQPPPEVPIEPVDLTHRGPQDSPARRLLVAGLTPLPDAPGSH